MMDAKCKVSEKPKCRKRKKIRRLVDSEESSQIVSNSRYKRMLIVTALIVCGIALLMGHYVCQNNLYTSIFKEFYKNYHNQYIEIVHGKSNYCDQNQPLDTITLFARIRQNHNILHQELGIRQIQVALRNESDINAIALVGPVGVGKTLFIRALQEHFPWPENVHTYAWNTYVNDESKKIKFIQVLIENLSECGHNLLVIENLQFRDHGAVSAINHLLSEANKKQHKRVVIFYIFSLNTMLTKEDYAEQNTVLQSLTNCKVISFALFSHHELRDCIQREAQIENVVLKKEDYDEIVETIDPFKSGCKNVNAKVLIYSTIKS